MFCTGLGQNWTRVWIVIKMVRADPSVIFKMLGRCGRDERPGLAMVLVEQNIKKVKNYIEDFGNTIIQKNGDWIDTLAQATVCLCVAVLIDNLWVLLLWTVFSNKHLLIGFLVYSKGYVLLKQLDTNVIEELEHKSRAGMAKCLCSNCNPTGAVYLIHNFHNLTKENFDLYVLDSEGKNRHCHSQLESAGEGSQQRTFQWPVWLPILCV